MSISASRLSAFLAAVVSSGAAIDVFAAELHGAGSTFVQPVIASWSSDWSAKTNVKITYDGVGSGAGVSKIKAGDVDFGATDAPLTPDELKASGLAQFPVVAGGIVAVENVTSLGAKRITITGPVLADIFSGRIKTWNDPQLKTLNPSLNLPAVPIAVIHRGDSSGTTYNFTKYLSRVSPQWQKDLGVGKTVNWPAGTGAEGNAKLGLAVTSTPNSIGYVEYGLALKQEMRIVSLKNEAGKNVFPTQRTIQAAVSAADWAHADHFNLMLVDSQGKDAWPIAATTWVVVPTKQSKGQSGQRTLDFFRWALHYGASGADALGYTPLPDDLVKLIEASWVKEIQE